MSIPFKGTKPPPFKRPGVTIGDGQNRSWQWIFPTDIQQGDILQDFGQVERVLDYGSETEVFHAIHKDETIFMKNSIKVFAFTLT